MPLALSKANGVKALILPHSRSLLTCSSRGNIKCLLTAVVEQMLALVALVARSLREIMAMVIMLEHSRL